MKSVSLKSTVLLLLLSPSFSIDHKHWHFVTLISISTFAFSALYFQICRNLPPTHSAGFSLPIHQAIVITTFLELAEHSAYISLHTEHAHSCSLKLRPTGREWAIPGQLNSLALQNREAIPCPWDLAAALC